MSKRNMLLGLAAGKIGDLVFYRDGGEQRTRSRVVPKNPRSPMQMTQRVKIANVSAFFRLFANVIRYSFTNLPSNLSGYNAFARQAIGISPYVTRDMALRGVVLPAPYALSKGTLQPLTTAVVDADQSLDFIVALQGLVGDMTSVSEVSSAILSNNQDFQIGDKIVCLAARFEADDSVPSGGAVTAEPYVSIFEIDTTSSATMQEVGFFTSQNALSPMVQGSSNAAIFAAIHVREDASAGIVVSSAVSVLSTAAQALYDKYRSTQALNDAILSYGVGGESILRE